MNKNKNKKIKYKRKFPVKIEDLEKSIDYWKEKDLIQKEEMIAQDMIINILRNSLRLIKTYTGTIKPLDVRYLIYDTVEIALIETDRCCFPKWKNK